MGAGASNSGNRKANRRQTKRKRKAMPTDRSEPEQEEGSSVETELVALPTGAIDVEEGCVHHVCENISIDANAIPHHLPADSTSAVLRPMDAGESNPRKGKATRRQSKRKRKLTGTDHSEAEQQDGSSVRTEITAVPTSPISVEQGRLPTAQVQPTTALPPPAPKEDTGNRVTPQVDGGILKNAQGVHIEGSATLISARNYTSVYNTVVQPDISEKDMALFEKIVEWLSDINYHAIQADNYGKRAEGTGEWVFDEPKIVDWMGGALGVLWGVGMPGAGKTVLASIIIDHLLQKAKANKRICVAFGFSRYTDQFTGDKVLAGLLRQVVQDHPSTLAFVKPMYDYHHQRKTRPSQKELLDVIQAVFNSDLFDERFCLPANLLLMSRPLSLLKDRVPDATFIDIILHEADIIQMIEDKIGRMPRLRNLLEKGNWKEKVVKVVLERSSGMFLVASLQLEALGSCINIKSLDTALQALPVGVNAMYEATMKRINGGPAPELALRALILLAYARESLKMDDFLHALAIEMEPFKYDSELLVDPNTVLSACCGLITFEPETKLVRLVHYTAQDFLVGYLPKMGVDAEVMLACTCVAHLQGCGFASYNSFIYGYSDDVFTHHPFLAYAHCNWAIHANSASLPPFVEEFILQCQQFPWKYPFWGGFDYLNSIQLAAACNFHSLISQWLGLDFSPTNHLPPFPLNVNSKSANGHTALALAAAYGHLKTVGLLIGVQGVDTQCFDSDGWSPLIAASWAGHVQVVDMLLGVVDADHVNAGSWTVLMHAASRGHTEVIKSLLCVQGINVNAREPDTGYGEVDSALTLAAWHGQLDAVQLLLGVDGIDVNASDSEDGTALVLASVKGHIDIVKLLLQREDIDVNSSQCQEGSALMQAASMGHKDVVELLLQQEEIDVNATTPDGHSALSLALEENVWISTRIQLEIAELLQAHRAQ
ncbi:hypothetical protein FA15DRAFT_759346 [Coprinopsis marcescibilis]|uniref:Nephrocystin 3-like N-terminal domain-containing protein n=1 Tax=Coprinopsis marcescibilis TaxID=230819 RepID=A0A5C3KKM5_COPMA|nr:hypothetical protein FA15DRAFT_759346 [Coprinopsis marcescibilis]